MFELLQAIYWSIAIGVPMILIGLVLRMIWRAGGLPAAENMRVLETMTEVNQQHSARIEAIEDRQDATDDHLRALGRDVAPMGRVVSIRGKR